MPSSITALYPVVAVDSPRDTAAAFAELFDLQPVFESDWYMHLASASGGCQVGLVRFDHESVPEGYQASVRGAFVTMDSNDVAAMWEEKKGRLDVVVPLADESWGQRHFICRLPGGVLVDVVQMLTE